MAPISRSPTSKPFALKDALGEASMTGRSEASAAAWPGRKAGTDRSTTIVRSWLREFQKGARRDEAERHVRRFRQAKPGRIAPEGTASEAEGIRCLTEPPFPATSLPGRFST
jgi:hypothetical protein